MRSQALPIAISDGHSIPYKPLFIVMLIYMGQCKMPLFSDWQQVGYPWSYMAQLPGQSRPTLYTGYGGMVATGRLSQQF